MTQLSFLNDDSEKIVNVASVPQRSPFRYPGGKTWLVPRIRHWLGHLSFKPSVFVEPFAGGAITGLTVAAEKLADRVVLVELDAAVAAVWTTIVSEDGALELAERIRAFQLTLDNVKAVLAQDALTTHDLAFQTIVKNRVNRGGILAPGAGLIKQGEAGKGLASRWYPETLAKRITAIAEYRDRITFVRGDGLQVMRDHRDDETACFFIDPPYTASSKRAGARLYRYHTVDHEALFALARSARGDFLMTYDNADEVQRLATTFEFEHRAIAMKNTHHARMSELLIGRQLAWLDR